MERVEEAAGRGDVRKIVDELVRAQSVLKESKVLFNFFHDLARNLNAKSAGGSRYHASTKHLYEVSLGSCAMNIMGKGKLIS
jgi:hypothetical protein